MNPDKDKINEYFLSLANWPQLQTANGPGGKEIGDSAMEKREVPGGEKTCAVKKFSLTQNPSEFMTFDPDPNLLWVGALLQGRDFSESLAELSIRERAPLKISISIPMEGNSVVVENPSNGNIWQDTSNLIEKVAALNPAIIGKAATLQVKQAFTFEQSFLDLGLSAKFAGGTMKARHQSTASDSGSSISVAYIEQCFTVSMDTPQTPADFFSDDFSIGDLNMQMRFDRIADDNIPIFVAGITFGRMLFITINSSVRYEDLRTSVEASFSGVGTNVGGNYTEGHRKIVMESNKIITAYGANNDEIEAVINSGTIAEFLKQEHDVRALKPISYSLYKITDNTLAQLSETTKYTVYQCGDFKGYPSEVVQHITDQVIDNLRAYYNYVVAATQNWSDNRTRLLRISQYMQFHSDVVTGLGDLRIHAVTRQDKDWVKHWLSGTITAEIERQIENWERGITQNSSDHGTRAVYEHAHGLSVPQRNLCAALIQDFT